MYVEFVKTNWMISAESFKPIAEFEVIKTKMPIQFESDEQEAAANAVKDSAKTFMWTNLICLLLA